LVALGTLTSLPVRGGGEIGRDELVASTAYYPFVGLVVGAAVAVAWTFPAPPELRAGIALALWIAVTGALHLDGWADCCDAALAPDRGAGAASRAWRLSILKDPHVGSFGVIGLIVVLLLKWIALSRVPAAAPVVAAVTARGVVAIVLRAFPPARPDGLAAAFAGRARAMVAGIAALAILAALAVLTHETVRIAIAAAAGCTAALFLARALARRFGGVTGDVCGAAAELAELAALFAFIPWTGA